MHLRIASSAARNLVGTLDADVAMVVKKIAGSHKYLNLV
jgi:hypothetical protein